MKKLQWMQRRKDAYMFLHRAAAPKPSAMVVHKDGELTATYDSRLDINHVRVAITAAHGKIVRLADKEAKVQWVRFAMPQERQEVSK